MSQADINKIAALDAETTRLSKTKQEPSHVKFIEGLNKIQEDNEAMGKLLERLAAAKQKPDAILQTASW